MKVGLLIGMVGSREEACNSEGTRSTAVGGVCVGILAEISSSVCCRRRSTQVGVIISFE
jgi:hypothetical protein